MNIENPIQFLEELVYENALNTQWNKFVEENYNSLMTDIDDKTKKITLYNPEDKDFEIISFYDYLKRKIDSQIKYSKRQINRILDNNPNAITVLSIKKAEIENLKIAWTKKEIDDCGFIDAAFDNLNTYISNKLSIKENSNVEVDSLKNENTKGRQVLAIYLILVALGIEKEFVNKTDIARLIHLLAGKALPNSLDNSEIYKKTKAIYNQTEKQNKKDLEYILDVIKPLSSINSEPLKLLIDRIKTELGSIEKTYKY